MRALKLGDRVLIVLGLVACAAGAIWLALGSDAATSDLVVVCQTQDGFRRVDALSDDVSYTVTVTDGDEAGYNEVVIANGAVEVVEADCSNQVCVEHDPISAEGEQIVCLPHGMVIEIVADEDDASTLW